ncbi:hypothetical protein [Trinickia sp.]|uniref:hypothetical protein n=1 Tax=Trinickia sp. TaxID=2571163 RepID=UPI003F7E2AF6
MADSAFHIVGRWAAAAFCAVAVSLAHAKPPHVPRAGFAAPPTAFRPVSDEARTLAREGGAAYLRAGSIRADIARYNEERGAPRPPRPPNTGARSSESAPVYRN